MCGIVGYISKTENAKSVLLDGLKRLEYRGYDSAGMALGLESGRVLRVRAKGAIDALEKKLKSVNGKKFHLGVAHTRWATHGVPSIKNAHPHRAGSIYLVHNGIIENHKTLRKSLEDNGIKFTSDTDTEVLAHLINLEYEKYGNLHKATRSALRKVKGAYAIAVIAENNGNELVVARNSSPLAIGILEDGYIIASDATAIAPYTKRVIYLSDGEVAELTTFAHKITTLGNKKRNRPENIIDIDPSELGKEGYEHFMQKEIFEQPNSVKDAMRGRIKPDSGEVVLGGLTDVADELRDIERVIFVGCGTARCAGLAGEYMIEEELGLPVEVEYSHEFRYRRFPINDKAALIAISQSGETADTLEAVKEAKRKNILTLGIVNAVGSSIARETVAGVYNHAGPEIAVASTKAYTSQLTILALLTVFLGRAQNRVKKARAKQILKELSLLPAKIKRFLKESEKEIKRIAKKYKSYESFYFLGKKYNYATAIEGSIKLKELSYIHAEGDAAGELKHGPLAMIDKNTPCIFIVPKDDVYEKTKSAIEEVKARKGKVIAITTKGNKELEHIADDVIYIPKTLAILTPILAVLPLQLLAYHIALFRGNNVDKPRNLAKSVTVE